MADDVDPEQHERVAKALEQVNGLKYRYHATSKEAKQVLTFDSDDSDDDEYGDAHGRGRARRSSSKATGKGGDDADDDADESDEDAQLSFDDHIDRILRKTRTIALLKIANNTAEILPEGEYDDDDDNFDDEYFDDDDDDGVDSFETVDHFSNGGDDRDALRTALSPSLRDQKSFRRGNSMRSSSSHHSTSSSGGGAGGNGRDHDESVIAMRLVRTLSSFLSLPRVISYKDLEMITETLLNEQAGSHDDYGDLIDFHIDSARDSSSAGGDGAAAATADDEAPIWKRRNTNTIQPLTLPDDPSDLELHQRRMFMEANRFSRFSSRNFLSASSKNLMPKMSMRLLGSPASALNTVGSFRSNASDAMLSKKESKHSGSFRSVAGSVAEDADHEESAEAGMDGDASGENEPRADPFDEAEYLQWRTEVKAEYLAWLNAKLEAKRKRRETLKKDAGKKPRWLLLYEASKRPERKESKK